MKVKKLLVLVVLLSLWGGTMMFADSVSQKIRIIVNGSELKENAVMIEGNTYLPMRQIADTLQSLIIWDESNKKVTLNKPNVHMVTFIGGTKIFGNVTKGDKLDFDVLAQVDSLSVSISGIKISIFDPYGREQIIQEKKVSPETDNFWFRTEKTSYKFENTGNYTIRLFMRQSGSDNWSIVSEKNISSKERE
jgi:hypothetical protein